MVKLPNTTKKEISDIVDEHQQDATKVEKYYLKIYSRKDVDPLFPTTTEGIARRHVWATRLLKNEFASRKATEEKNILIFGRGPVNAFKNQQPDCRLWVFDYNSKEKYVMTLNKRLLLAKALENITLFAKYNNIELIPQSDGWMGIDDRAFPFPDPEPMNATPEEIFNKLRVKSITQDQLGDINNLSKRTSEGKFIYSDIKVIRNIQIAFGSVFEVDVDGIKFNKCSFGFSDDTTKGYTTDGGTEIPQIIRTYADGIFYNPKGSEGDVYGTLRLKQDKSLSFECCYFDCKMAVPEEK